MPRKLHERGEGAPWHASPTPLLILLLLLPYAQRAYPQHGGMEGALRSDCQPRENMRATKDRDRARRGREEGRALLAPLPWPTHVERQPAPDVTRGLDQFRECFEGVEGSTTERAWLCTRMPTSWTQRNARVSLGSWGAWGQGRTCHLSS